MIPFVTILEHYENSLHKKYSTKLLPGHLKAISAIKRCRTALSGEFHVQCTGCGHSEWHPKSCGHRSCPQCQNHEASEWLMRQQKKQLPVDYYGDLYAPCSIESFDLASPENHLSADVSLCQQHFKRFWAQPQKPRG